MTDIKQAYNFIAALTGDMNSPVTFQTFDEKGQNKLLARILHGPLALHASTLSRLNEDGAGVFVTVNETDLKGRTADNVVALRALFVDKDDGRLTPNEASLITHSARGDHAYWLLKPEEKLGEFSRAQEHLASFYHTDRAVKDLSRVMRLPGFLHNKGEPVLVTFDWGIKGLRTIDEVLALHPLPSTGLNLGLSSAKGPKLPSNRIPVGGRNNHLMSLAGSMRRNGMSETAILAGLLAANTEFAEPLGEAEVQAVVNSAGRYPPDPQAVAVGVATAGFPMNDSGNAERLVHYHKDKLRYLVKRNKWIAWDGMRWSMEGGDLRALLLAKETVRSMATEPALISSAESDAAIFKFIAKSSSASARAAMVKLAAAEPGMTISTDELDANPWTINMPGGLVDLRTGEVRPAVPSDFVTKIAAAARRGAHAQGRACGSWRELAPTWARFLEDVTCGDAEFEGYLQRAVGYTLTGSTQEHCLFFLHGVGNSGNGANGKSTFLDTIMLAMGEYARVGSSDLLLAKRDGVHPTDRASIAGARMVVCPEVDEGRTWDESLVKQLTGDARISARGMREDFWDYTPTYKFWVTGNHKPVVRGTDHGIWRRIRLLPFLAVFRPGDKTMLSRLGAELDGVMAWAIEGAREWSSTGLGEPARVRGATEAYRESQDVVGQFLAEYTVRDEAGRVKRSDMRRAYEHWCEANGCKPVGAKRLIADLEARGIGRTGGVRQGAPRWIWSTSFRTPSTLPDAGWAGIRIKSETELGMDIPTSNLN